MSSFANTSGGDLVLGVDATKGIPTTITPLAMPLDSEILRLEQVARGGLQPRIANIAFQTVPILGGGNVAATRRTASSARAATGFGHARPPGSMSRTSMNSGRFSMPLPSSRIVSATLGSTASPKSPPGRPRFS
jgi:hypothetical protein